MNQIRTQESKGENHERRQAILINFNVYYAKKNVNLKKEKN